MRHTRKGIGGSNPSLSATDFLLNSSSTVSERSSMEPGALVYAAFMGGLLCLGMWVIVGTRP